MREAKRTRDGRWVLTEEEQGAARILQPDWNVDLEGHWPRVTFDIRDLEEEVACPSCGARWRVQETDFVFGTARRAGNDLLLLVTCYRCRLPHRVRALGFATAYPALLELMEGWSGWSDRERTFRAEEERLFGGS